MSANCMQPGVNICISFAIGWRGQILRENDLYESEFNWGTGAAVTNRIPMGRLDFRSRSSI